MEIVDVEPIKLHSGGTGYTVQMVDAKGVIYDAVVDVSKQMAAREFQLRTKNISALSGIIQRVAILDKNGVIGIMWEFGKGYTYDGENYTPSPVLETEVKSYAKAKSN
jgi:hypothetical protein